MVNGGWTGTTGRLAGRETLLETAQEHVMGVSHNISLSRAVAMLYTICNLLEYFLLFLSTV